MFERIAGVENGLAPGYVLPMNETRTALVLGASGTIGGAMARELNTRGWKLAQQACMHPDRCAPSATPVFTADFRDAAQIEKLAKDAVAALGRIDALIWAAGISRDASVLTQKDEDLREVLAVDLTAPFLLCKHLARQFIKQRGGSVVFVSSHAGLSGRAGGAAYAMAQSGLLALAKSLAREWGPSGVRVNAVVPPFVPDSAMGRAASPEFVAAARKKNVLKADTAPADAVARFVADLLENPAASGQVFTLDARIAG
ncbi:MAG: SDR family oxidoreductase [Planctomycetes bacterium]|nr:SDR family oxidoreductase [Planctomycetota bacterium]